MDVSVDLFRQFDSHPISIMTKIRIQMQQQHFFMCTSPVRCCWTRCKITLKPFSEIAKTFLAPVGVAMRPAARQMIRDKKERRRRNKQNYISFNFFFLVKLSILSLLEALLQMKSFKKRKSICFGHKSIIRMIYLYRVLEAICAVLTLNSLPSWVPLESVMIDLHVITVL